VVIRKLPEISINSFQLAVLLDKTEKHFYNVVIEHFVFCALCRAVANEGIVVEEICLTAMNDIRVQGSFFTIVILRKS